MLREMHPDEWLMWQTFSSLEPFGEERADLRTAAIEQALYNIHRDRKIRPDPFTLAECLLGLGDMPHSIATSSSPAQTIETMELHLDVWCAMQNMVMAAKGKTSES